jgi:hypothetical protein
MADGSSPTWTFPDVVTELADTFCHPIGGSENGTVVPLAATTPRFGLVTRGDLLMVELFLLDRGKVLDRGMKPRRVVPMDPRSSFAFQLGTAQRTSDRMLVDQSDLYSPTVDSIKPIVECIADAADRPGDPGLPERFGERNRSILAARVRLVH